MIFIGKDGANRALVKLVSIAEVQPILCKDTYFSVNTPLSYSIFQTIRHINAVTAGG